MVSNNKVLRIMFIAGLLLPIFNLNAQIMVRIAGNGTCGHTGDGGPARSASLCGPWGLAVDSADNVYFGDWHNNVIRKIAATGSITNFAGNGQKYFPAHGPDGARYDTSAVGGVWYIFFDPHGNMYYNEEQYFIRKISTSGVLTTVAGNASGTGGYLGDGTAATANVLFLNGGMAMDKMGNIYTADNLGGFGAIRKISPSGIITTVAGYATSSGYGTDTADGAAATAALIVPLSLVFDDSDNLAFSDLANHQPRIRRINHNGTITTLLGGGSDTTNGAAANATKYSPSYLGDIAYSPEGELYYCESNKIRKISKTGIVTSVVGTGTAGFSGDSVIAATSMVNGVNNLAFDKHGNLYFEDEWNERVWKVVLYPEKTESMPEAQRLAISPNPSTGIFDIRDNHKYTRLCVLNILGQVVLEKIITQSDFSIDLRDQPNGVFVVELYDETGGLKNVQRVIKR